MPSVESLLQELFRAENQTNLDCLLKNPDIFHKENENLHMMQEHLMAAINILGLLVKSSEDKKVSIASQTFNTDDIAVTVLHMVCLVYKLGEK